MTGHFVSMMVPGLDHNLKRRSRGYTRKCFKNHTGAMLELVVFCWHVCGELPTAVLPSFRHGISLHVWGFLWFSVRDFFPLLLSPSVSVPVPAVLVKVVLAQQLSRGLHHLNDCLNLITLKHRTLLHQNNNITVNIDTLNSQYSSLKN